MSGGCKGATGSSLLALVLAPSLTGCSLLFVHKPPARPPPSAAMECTTSVAAPVVDVVVAALEVVRVAYALSQDDGDYEDFPISRGADVGFGVAFAALFAGSSAYGFANTSACAAMQHQHPREEAPSAAYGCTRDDQCKGDRICEAGTCVRPSYAPRPASPSPDASRVPPPAGPTAAFGYGFAATREAVEAACTAGGGTFTTTGPDAFECPSAQARGSDAPIVTLRFCADVLCEVEATYPVVPPTFHEWAERYDAIEHHLRRQLGAPVQQQRAMTDACATDYRACLAAESTAFYALWKWPDASQVWLRSTPEGTVRLTYTGAKPVEAEPPP